MHLDRCIYPKWLTFTFDQFLFSLGNRTHDIVIASAKHHDTTLCFWQCTMVPPGYFRHAPLCIHCTTVHLCKSCMHAYNPRWMHLLKPVHSYVCAENDTRDLRSLRMSACLFSLPLYCVRTLPSDLIDPLITPISTEYSRVATHKREKSVSPECLHCVKNSNHKSCIYCLIRVRESK